MQVHFKSLNMENLTEGSSAKDDFWVLRRLLFVIPLVSSSK